jgi:hypothetical protein
VTAIQLSTLYPLFHGACSQTSPSNHHFRNPNTRVCRTSRSATRAKSSPQSLARNGMLGASHLRLPPFARAYNFSFQQDAQLHETVKWWPSASQTEKIWNRPRTRTQRWLWQLSGQQTRRSTSDDWFVILHFPDGYQLTHEYQVFHNWTTDPYAKAVWVVFRTNEGEKALPVLRESVSNVHLASSDWAQGWRGFVEGAIEQGLHTAVRV